MSSDLKPLSGFTNSWSQSDSLSNVSEESTSSSSKWLWLVLIVALAFGGLIYLAKDTDIISYLKNVFTQVSQLIMGNDTTNLETVKTATTPSDIPQQQQSEPVQQQQSEPVQQQQPYPTSYSQSNNFPPKQMEPVPASSMDAENKSGWCYVGEQQDFRSCIEVGELDTCLSGDIFPSHEICVNPNLRA